MKKLRKSLYVKFRPVILYRDNFYKIYKIFKEQCGKVTIIADYMELEKSEEIDDFVGALLKEEFTDISNLDIQGHSPGISLTLTKYSTELYAKNDSAKDKEIFEELREILKHKQISNFNIQNNVGFFIYFMIIFSIFIISIVEYIDTVNQEHINIPLDVIPIFVMAIVFFIVKFVSIHKQNKHKVLHLKKEYKDTKLLNKCEKYSTICTIIAGIVVAILVAIFKT